MTRRYLLAGFMALALTMGAVAEAQDLARFYVVPKVGSGTFADPFRAKYFRELGVQFSAMDYGKEDSMLVGAEVTGAQHTTLAANLDVIAIPTALDNNVSSAALTTIQNKLEGLKIPAGWVTTSHTYRQVVGAVGRIFMLMQRFDGLHMRTFFGSDITLDTRINQLTVQQRTDLQTAASSLGLDTSFVTGPMTIRTVFKTWIDNMGPFTLHGEIF
jgi:hypothetical protein